MADFILVEARWDEKADTAAWLLATADAKGIDRKLIQTRNAGFLVPVELLGDFTVTDARLVQPSTIEVTVEREVVEPTMAEVVETVKEVRRELAAGVSVPPDRETVRAWAKAQGLEVADKGRLAASVYEAYQQAHS